MNFSNKILQLADLPNFKKDQIFDNKVSIDLAHNQAKLIISFNTIIISDEVCFDQISYQTDLCGPYLGLFDGYVTLMHKRPLEAIDRFPPKELDFYLRDIPTISSISGFDEKFYEILGIGEEIKKFYFKIDKDHTPKLKQEFRKISLSEQLEFIEEVFAYHIYSSASEFNSLEVVDVENDTIVFENQSNKKININDLTIFINKNVSSNLSVQVLDK